MNSKTQKRQVSLIYLVFIWTLLHLACGTGTGDITPGENAPAREPKVTVKKPVPVFQPQAVITMADGTVYEVADFAFYSNHRDFKVGVYSPDSGSKKWFLYLTQGPIWKKFDVANVKSLTISKSNRVGWLKIDLVQLDGTKLQGLHPFYAYNNLWYKHGVVYLMGKAEALGKTGNFKCQIAGVFSIDKLDAAEGPPKFKIIHNWKKRIQTTITNPELKLIWENVTPTYLDVYRLRTNMPVTVNNTKVKIKPQEIESITVPQKSSALFTVKMKKGDTVKLKLPPRIFGRLKNGDIIFSNMFGKGKPIIKKIRIK